MRAAVAATEAQTWAASLCHHTDAVHNCRADAVRHAYWAALLVGIYGFSGDAALAALSSHERTNVESNNPHNESVMDMENNLKGLSITGNDTAAIQDSVRAAADRGDLTVLDELPNQAERGLLVPSDLQEY